jgi:RimJ/RimL family protein N-acetyltransferase
MSQHAGACDGWDNGSCSGTPYCPPRCPRFVDDAGTPLVVRPVRSSDREALREMYDDVEPEARTMGVPPADREARADWLDALLETGWALVALDGDRVVGHVSVAPVADTEPELVVFVRRSFRGRGVGAELLRQLVAYAAAGEYDALELDVARDNERALAVYESLGFETVDRAFGSVAMRLPLSPEVAEPVSGPPAATE